MNYMYARRDLEVYTKYYEEGRVTLLVWIRKSERLMEAQIALSPTKVAEIDFASAHLLRVSQAYERERKEFEEGLTLCCHCGGWIAELTEAKDYLGDFKGKISMMEHRSTGR